MMNTKQVDQIDQRKAADKSLEGLMMVEGRKELRFDEIATVQ